MFFFSNKEKSLFRYFCLETIFFVHSAIPYWKSLSKSSKKHKFKKFQKNRMKEYSVTCYLSVAVASLVSSNQHLPAQTIRESISIFHIDSLMVYAGDEETL